MLSYFRCRQVNISEIKWYAESTDNANKAVQKAYILGIYNTEKITEEESFNMPSKISQLFIQLMGDEFLFTNFQLRYADINGMYELITSNNNVKALSYEDLIFGTHKYRQDELPTDYLKWLDKVNMQ